MLLPILMPSITDRRKVRVEHDHAASFNDIHPSGSDQVRAISGDEQRPSTLGVWACDARGGRVGCVV